MKRKLFIIAVILAFSFGLFSIRVRALTLSGTAANEIVQVMDSHGNILDGVHSAISGISYPNEIVQVMNSTGTILDNFGITLPGSGVAASIPQTYWDFTPGVGKSVTSLIPSANLSAATRVEFCVAGGGGGGGAATSGGATALCGSNGGSGSIACIMMSGGTLLTALASGTYTLGGGGSAGTCSAAPSAAQNGSVSSLTVNSTVIVSSAATTSNKGQTASTTVTGAAASGATIYTTTGTAQPVANLTFSSVTYELAGQASPAGGSDAATAQPNAGGGFGGAGLCVTSGGVCDATFPGTNGGNGFVKATVYFQ